MSEAQVSIAEASDSTSIKVAICITGLEVGGAETFLAELLRLRPDDTEFRVYSLIDGGLVADRIQAMGIEVVQLHMRAGRPSFGGLFRLVSELRRYRPDIVHTWMYHSDLLGGIAARLAGVRHIIWHLHNSDLSPQRVRFMTRLVVRANALLSHWVPEVIVSCSEAAVRVHRSLGYSARRFLVVPNGVDTERFAPFAESRESVFKEFGFSSDLPLIGLVARVDPQKNHRGFFEAVRVFFESGEDAQFLLVGRGVTEDHWKLPGWRDATGRPERVVLAGPRADVPRLMAALDVATSSSLGEAFPLVLIEAMACGVPCVATDVGDSALIVDGAGVVVPPDDPAALASAWRELIALPADQLVELGLRARHRVVANYTLQESAERIWALYRAILLPGFSVELLSQEFPCMPCSSTTRGSGDSTVGYLSLQAVAEGQDSWAAVMEIVTGWERAGWSVDRWFPRYPRSGAPGAFGRARAMWRLQTALRRRLGVYDALYIRGHTMAYPVARWARAAGVPIVQECNGTYEDLFIAWPAARLGRPIFEYMQRAQFRDADLIFCGTEEQKRWLEAETGHQRIIVSPNGANADLFRPDVPVRPGLPERFVLFFGQFAPWQGLEVLVAAKRDSAWPEGVHLVFAGDGERRAVVEAAVASDPTVHYLGRLPYEELPAVIAHSIASTSVQYTSDRGETGFSALKLYESMACGVPVIGSDYPGVGDIIRRYDCGIVVPPGDASALAQAVARLVEHEDDAREMGMRGRAAVELECSWSARAEQRRQAIGRIISRRLPS
jgi:glycosyltransferase involved in cell wall biosynthesis